MSRHCNIYRHIRSILSGGCPILVPAAVCLSLQTATTAAQGLNIALLGDSLTWIGGDSCSNATGWTSRLRHSRIADRIDVYARSGATWTNTPETRPDTAFYSEVLHPDNVMYNQALRLTQRVADGSAPSPDIVVLYAGANDAWFSDHRPGIFDSTAIPATLTDSDETPVSKTTSLAGSVDLVCSMIQKKFPTTELLVITPAQMSKVPAEAIHSVSDIIEAAASNRGIRVIRPDRECAIIHEQELSAPRYTYDGVHTNAEGARLLGDFILEKMDFRIE